MHMSGEASGGAAPFPRRVALALLLAVALVSLPGGMDSPLGGTPLSGGGRIALSALLCVGVGLFFFPLRRAPGWWLPGALAGLVVIKLGLAAFAVPHGWRTEYRFGDTTGAMHDAQFYWRFANRGYRIEPSVRIDDQHSNLHFLNDVPLYGYPPYIQTRRDIRFPIEVTWTGYVATTAARDLVFLATGAGRVTITTPAGEHGPVDAEAVRYPFRLPEGRHRLTITYDKPENLAPAIMAGLVDVATGTPVITTPESPSGRQWGAAGATTAVVLGGLVLLVLALATSYGRFGTSAPEQTLVVRAVAFDSSVILAGWATVLALRMMWHTKDFGGGGDPLIYAGYARDILHNGILMLLGKPIGQAEPFYFYPLYPYLLAAGHALIGEDLSSIYLVNGWMLALLPVLFFALGWKRLAPGAGIVAFVALLVFTYTYTNWFVTFSEPVFTDFPFLLMVFATLVALERALADPRPWRLIVAGVVMALGAATRPSLMTLFYLSPLALWIALDRPRVWRWALSTAWLAAGLFVGLLPFALRNLLAAGRFVTLVNSWIQIPYFLIPPEVTDRPGGIPSLGEALVMAKDIFLAHPVRTLTVEVRKLLYTVGITDAGPAGFEHARFFVVLTILFAWALGSRRLRGPMAIAVTTFAVSHIGAMVIAAPWTFHYKSILPLHAAFLFGAAFLMQDVGRSTDAAAGSGVHRPSTRDSPMS